MNLLKKNVGKLFVETYPQHAQFEHLFSFICEQFLYETLTIFKLLLKQ